MAFGDFCKGKGVYQGVGYLRAYKSQDSAPNEISVVYGHEDSLGGVQFNRQLRIDPQPDNVQISSHNGAKLKDRDIVFQSKQIEAKPPAACFRACRGSLYFIMFIRRNSFWISCIRCTWPTWKGQRASQWPQDTQSEAFFSRLA